LDIDFLFYTACLKHPALGYFFEFQADVHLWVQRLVLIEHKNKQNVFNENVFGGIFLKKN